MSRRSQTSSRTTDSDLSSLPKLQEPVETSTSPEELVNNWENLLNHARMRKDFVKLGFDLSFPFEYAFPEWATHFNFEVYYLDPETAKRNATRYFNELRPHIDAALSIIEEADGDLLRIERRWELTTQFWSGELSKEEEEKRQPAPSVIKKADGRTKMKKDGPYKAMKDIVEDVSDVYTEVSRFHNHMKEVGKILRCSGNLDIINALGNLTV